MGKILITGATGFIGSHVTRQLVDRGYENLLCTVSESSSRWRLQDLDDRIECVPIEYASGEGWRTIFEAHTISDVLHIGWSGVERSANQSDIQFVNYPLSMRLAELASRSGCRSFISLGSQAEYGPKKGRISESESTNPTTVYGIAKLAVYESCRHLFRLRGNTRFVWLRVFSTYGPDDNDEWLLPSLIKQLGDGQTPALTPGGQQWDFLHVDDAAEAVVACLETSSAEGLFNLGHGTARSLREYVELARDAVDPDLALGFGEIPYAENQVMHLEADISRLADATGWSPSREFEREIGQIVDYRLNRG